MESGWGPDSTNASQCYVNEQLMLSRLVSLDRLDLDSGSHLDSTLSPTQLLGTRLRYPMADGIRARLGGGG